MPWRELQEAGEEGDLSKVVSLIQEATLTKTWDGIESACAEEEEELRILVTLIGQFRNVMDWCEIQEACKEGGQICSVITMVNAGGLSWDDLEQICKESSDLLVSLPMGEILKAFQRGDISELLSLFDSYQFLHRRSGIHEACKEGDMSEVIALIEQDKRNVNMRKRNDWTPLQCASLNGHTDIVKLLLDNGADVTALTSRNASPLHHSVMCNQIDVLNVLVERGVNINQQNSDGDTALHLAACRGYLEIVKSLTGLAACDVSIKNNDGRTPLEYAEYAEESEVILYLSGEGTESTDTNTSTQQASIGCENEAKFSDQSLRDDNTELDVDESAESSQSTNIEVLDHDKLYKIAIGIGTAQTALGVTLGLSPPEVRQIQKEHHYVIAAALAILHRWHEKEDNLSETEKLEKLKEALLKIGKADLVELMYKNDKKL